MLGSVVWWCFSLGCCSVTYFCLTGWTALLSEECDIFEKRLTCCFNFAPQRRMAYLSWRRRLWTPPTLRRPSRPFWQVRSAFLTFGGINTPVHVSTFIRRSSQWGMSSVTKATTSLTWQHSLHLLRKWSTVQFLLKVFLLSEDFMRLITVGGKSAVEWSGLSYVVWRTYLIGVANRLSSRVRWPTAEIKLFLLELHHQTEVIQSVNTMPSCGSADQDVDWYQN